MFRDTRLTPAAPTASILCSLALVLLAAGPARGQLVVDLALTGAHFTVHGASPGDRLSSTRAVEIGDLDGDGQADLVVGEPRWGRAADGERGPGRVHVVLGPLPYGGVLDLATATADVTILGRGDIALGWSIAIGDVSGDGAADLVMGAPFGGDADERQGEVLVVFGPLGSRPAIDLAAEAADARFIGATSESRFGTAVSVAPNAGPALVLAVGAPEDFAEVEPAVFALAGRAHYLEGPFPGGTLRRLGDEPAEGVFDGPRAEGQWGSSLAFGEFAVPGFREAAVGGPGDHWDHLMDRDCGLVHVLMRGISILIGPESAGVDRFGEDLTTGDVTGSGFEDMVSGGAGTDELADGSAAVNAGQLAILSWLPAAHSPLPTVIGGREAGDLLGTSVGAGDVTGDGAADLLGGAPGSDGPEGDRIDAGGVYALAERIPPVTSVDLSAPFDGALVYGARAGDELGTALATGELTGDGLGDVAVGAAGSAGPSGDRAEAGAVLVLRGPLSTEPTLSCDAGGPYVLSCAEVPRSPLGYELQLDGTGSLGEIEDYEWSISCGSLAFFAEGPDPTVPAAASACGPPCLIRLTVRQGTLELSCETTVEVVDTNPPALGPLGPDLVVACDELPPPEPPVATDDCLEAVPLVLEELRVDGPCAGSYELRRTWTASDACGNSSQATRVLQVVDEQPPALLGVPADATVSCDAVPEPAAVEGRDACSPVVAFELGEERIDGGCPDAYRLVRTWTATDECGNTGSAAQVLSVVDRAAPALLGVPADATVSCDAVPPPPSVSALDDCDPEPSVELGELRIDGPCVDEYQLRRTWTATDRCGNASSGVQVLSVVDRSPPVLVGVPADATVSCDAVPPPPVVSALDDCDPGALPDFAELRIDGRCRDEYQLVRSWSATDRCGNRSEAVQLLTVVDETPPVIEPGDADLLLLWPPRHGPVCLERSAFAPEVADSCGGPVDWRFSGCFADQEDEGRGTGDGHTEGDCLVEAEGELLCLRAERDGTGRSGRRYAVEIVATDACGNESEPVRIGFVRVPHDRRERLSPGGGS